MAVANARAEHTGSFFMRVYETVTMHLHERAANSFLRAQAIVDTVTAGKMAAVAASAAAVAGGGFAVEGVVSPPGDSPASILRGAQSIASLPVVQQRSQPRAHTRHAAKTKARPKPRTRTRVATHPRATAPPARPPVNGSPATSTHASAPRAVAASSSHGASSAAGEFGFEGP